MAKSEVSEQYIGSFLGIFWAFIHPAVLISVFWVIFSIGFRVQPLNDVPFVVWLTAGMAPWFVFSDIINRSTNSIRSHSHLIKKTLFHSQLLPIIKIISSLIVHFIFLIVLLLLILFQHMPISFYYFQFIYYLFCLCFLTIGFGWILSALNVFIQDISQIVTVILQIGFWATPIFWNIEMMPEKIQMILKLNPMYYIVQGYRDTFINFIPFWEHPILTIYFWIFCLIVFFFGVLIFIKLKPQFADVL